MYREISNAFRDQSKQLKNAILFIFIPILYFATFILVLRILDLKHIAENWIVALLSIAYALFICATIYLFILLAIRKEDEFSWKKFWNIYINVKLYITMVHDKDIKLLIKLLKKHEINTRPKVLEVIRHYQCLLPRKIVSNISLISLLALCVSILAFVFNNYTTMSAENRVIVFIIITFAFLLYLIIYYANKYILCYIGERALHERIESALSEIWMKSLIK